MSETINDGIPDALDTTVVAGEPPPTAEDTGAVETDDATVPVTEKQAPEPTSEPPKKPWYQTRIEEEAWEKREAKRRVTALEAEVAQLRQAAPARSQPEPEGLVPAAEVEKRAAEIVAENRFVESCNSTYYHGVAKYPDFADAAKTYGLLGEIPEDFLQAITSLGEDDGARVYYELGKNPDNAARVLKLPPTKMAMEIAKMAYTKTASSPRPVSKAPAPIEPITSSRARTDAEPDEVKEPKAWMDWFQKQRLARRA